MCLRILLLLVLSVGGWSAAVTGQSSDATQSSGATQSSDADASSDSDPTDAVRSSVQVMGLGFVTLKPTRLRLSIPIKAEAESAWDATEALRSLRGAVVERATEMGALPESLKVFGFQCGQESPASFLPSRGETTKPKFVAECYVVADFPLREGQDYEETMGLSQVQLGQLASLLPEAQPNRRSYSISTHASGFSSQQLESPLAVFVATVSAEDRAKAFRQAFVSADEQIRATLDALGVKNATRSVSQTPNYTSLRPMHPLEAVLGIHDPDEVVGVHVDGVQYTVRLMVSAHFRQDP